MKKIKHKINYEDIETFSLSRVIKITSRLFCLFFLVCYILESIYITSGSSGVSIIHRGWALIFAIASFGFFVMGYFMEKYIIETIDKHNERIETKKSA